MSTYKLYYPITVPSLFVLALAKVQRTGQDITGKLNIDLEKYCLALYPTVQKCNDVIYYKKNKTVRLSYTIKQMERTAMKEGKKLLPTMVTELNSLVDYANRRMHIQNGSIFENRVCYRCNISLIDIEYYISHVVCTWFYERVCNDIIDCNMRTSEKMRTILL